MSLIEDKIRNLILKEYRSVIIEKLDDAVWEKVENYPFAIIPAKDFEKPIIFRNTDETKFVQTMAKLIAKDPLGTLGKKIAGYKWGDKTYDFTNPEVLKKYIGGMQNNPVGRVALEINPRFIALLGFDDKDVEGAPRDL